jgi:hypothetical protein
VLHEMILALNRKIGYISSRKGCTRSTRLTCLRPRQLPLWHFVLLPARACDTVQALGSYNRP